MSAVSFRSVFMVASCAGAALGCYMVSLRVASTHEDGSFHVYLEDVAPDGRFLMARLVGGGLDTGRSRLVTPRRTSVAT